jgi:hypothetical protein
MNNKVLFKSIEQLEESDLTEDLQLDEPNPLDNAFKSGVYEYLNWFYDGEQDDFLL